jgi:hypothetical protein
LSAPSLTGAREVSRPFSPPDTVGRTRGTSTRTSPRLRRTSTSGRPGTSGADMGRDQPNVRGLPTRCPGNVRGGPPVRLSQFDSSVSAWLDRTRPSVDPDMTPLPGAGMSATAARWCPPGRARTSRRRCPPVVRSMWPALEDPSVPAHVRAGVHSARRRSTDRRTCPLHRPTRSEPTEPGGEKACPARCGEPWHDFGHPCRTRPATSTLTRTIHPKRTTYDHSE